MGGGDPEITNCNIRVTEDENYNVGVVQRLAVPVANSIPIPPPFPVACAWGELAHDATVVADSDILVTSDVSVPDATTLTLNEGVVFELDGYDEANLGDHATKVELVVDDGGTLTVSGTSSNQVQFTSSQGTKAAGDWYGITIKNDATATIDSALVRYSSYGIVDKSGETTRIRGCSFQDNETYDIVVGYAGYPDNLNDAVVSGNSITVGTGTGIHLETAFIGGTTIEDNTITGNASSYSGIDLGVFTDGTTPAIEGNTISGFSNGSGISSQADPTITGNSIGSSKYGVELTGGSATVGLTTGGTNNITGNTTGILANKSASDVEPAVRKNFIYGNTYGVQVKSGADPDLGTDSSHRGNNNITGSGTYCIWNRNPGGSPTVRAYGNYFGACSGGNPPSCWSGSVNTGGWLWDGRDAAGRPVNSGLYFVRVLIEGTDTFATTKMLVSR